MTLIDVVKFRIDGTAGFLSVPEQFAAGDQVSFMIDKEAIQVKQSESEPPLCELPYAARLK